MKKITLALIATVAILFQSFGLSAQDLQKTQRFIKAGNSLREVHQYSKSKELLTQGLSYAKKLGNKYWEAAANEYLGILYATVNNPSEAKVAFNNAKNIYHTLHYSLSERAIIDMMSKYNITDEEEWSYYGGIEIGSKGVKYSIIKARQIETQTNFDIEKDGSANTQVIDFTDNAVKETADAVKTFYDILLQNKIAEKNIFIAVSSGVKQEADKKDPSGKVEENLKGSIARAVPTYQKAIKVLNAKEEVDWSIKGAIPANIWDISTLTDIGSGNTKGGAYKNDVLSSSFSIPWGSSTFGKKIAGKDFGFANQFYEDNIKQELLHSISSGGDFTNGRQVHYVTGGIVWVMCNYLHPEEVNMRVTAFTKNDVDKFLELAKTNYESLINPDLSGISDDAIRNEAKKQIENSQKAFNKDNVIAGALILKGWIVAMGNNGGSNYKFIRQGYVGWISGYIANSISEDYNEKANAENAANK